MGWEVLREGVLRAITLFQGPGQAFIMGPVMDKTKCHDGKVERALQEDSERPRLCLSLSLALVTTLGKLLHLVEHISLFV